MSPKPHVFTNLDKTARIGAIYLVRTQITDAEVAKLKEALPNCEISR